MIPTFPSETKTCGQRFGILIIGLKQSVKLWLEDRPFVISYVALGSFAFDK